MEENSVQKSKFLDEEYELDYKKYLNIIKRNLKFLFITSGSITVGALIYTFIAKPIYKGSFEIIVENKSNITNSKGFSINDALSTNINMISKGKDLKTQQLILQSPLVLEPIFNYVKENDSQLKFKNIPSYKSWRKKYLKINFEEDTNILNISYQNQNKSFIIDVLTEISGRYKKYSKSDREKEINRTIDFLTTQQSVYKIKSKASRKKLNLFTIKNGLGDIDGFIELDNNRMREFSFDNSMKNSHLEKLMDMSKSPLKTKTSRANQRYQNQFDLLQTYEARYTDFSSRLKPESSYLRDLKIKIDNLKLALKRPNEILLQLRELKTIAEREENVLLNIEDELVMMNLEKVKQQDPWKMISNPTIDSERVFPQRKLIILYTFLISSIFAFIVALIREKKSDKIYELNDIDYLMKIPYIDTIYSSDVDLSKKLINSLINKYKELKVGIVELKSINSSGGDISVKSEFIDSNKLNIVNLSDDNSIKRCDKIFAVVESGKCTNYQILFFNKIINIYPNKFLGWLFVKEKL